MLPTFVAVAARSEKYCASVLFSRIAMRISSPGLSFTRMTTLGFGTARRLGASSSSASVAVGSTRARSVECATSLPPRDGAASPPPRRLRPPRRRRRGFPAAVVSEARASADDSDVSSLDSSVFSPLSSASSAEVSASSFSESSSSLSSSAS